MPEVPYEIVVWCSCGKWLVAKSMIDCKANTSYFEVEPCESCIRKSTNKALKELAEKGKDEK